MLLALLLAAVPEVNLSLLRPASGADGLLGVEGTRPLTDPEAPLELQLGLDAAWLPVRPSGLRVESRIGGWLQLHARLNDRLSIFAQLPATAHESGQISSGFGVGDIRLGVRGALGPDLAAQLSLETATAPLQTLTGDDRLVVEALVSASRRREQIELIGNAYLRFRPPRDVGPARLGNELGLRAGAAYWHSPRARTYLELEAQSSLRALSQASLPLEWRAGATLCFSGAFAFDAAGGTRLDDALGAPSLRGVFAVRYAPSLCRPPKREGPEPGLQELVAALAKERAAREKAADDERMLSMFAPSEGDAREVAARAQALDLLAASEAEARRRLAAFIDEDRRDSDGDGVPDRVDNCPFVKGPPENHGCPLAQKQLVVLREDRIDILQKIFFAIGRARIQPRSHKLLDQVAQVLKSHPSIARVEVQGHTDDRGGAAVNTALSQARAEAVVGYLIKRGVQADRLMARGYGPSRPIAANSTAKGREQNRRVEFHVVERE